MAGFEIEVDASDLKRKIDMLKNGMSPQRFNRAMYTIFNRTGRHVSAILRKDLPQQYAITPGAITKAVKTPRITSGFGSVGCIIPVVDPRRFIGNEYKASGGAHGWNNIRPRRRKYKVKAQVLAGGQSTLPDKWHTGYPPFRNLSMNKQAYARTSKARGPLKKITGISIPQMPMNRSEPDVQQDIKEYLEREIEHRLWWMMNGGS